MRSTLTGWPAWYVRATLGARSVHVRTASSDAIVGLCSPYICWCVFGSFSSNVEENIDKTRKKAGMLFSANFDRRKVNPLVYITLWRQARLPSLLYGTELFTITPTLLEKSERCQQWFLKHVFYVPEFAPKRLLLKLSRLNSFESEIALKKLLFLGRLITGQKMTPALQSLFELLSKSLFDANIISLGVFPSIFEALHKFDLFLYFDEWFQYSIFPTYTSVITQISR